MRKGMRRVPPGRTGIMMRLALIPLWAAIFVLPRIDDPRLRATDADSIAELRSQRREMRRRTQLQGYVMVTIVLFAGVAQIAVAAWPARKPTGQLSAG